MIKKTYKNLAKFKEKYPLMLWYIIGNFINAILLRLFTTGHFGLRAIFFDFAFIILLTCLSLLFKNRGRITYYLITTVLMVFICGANTIYYNYYSSFISVSLLSTAVFLKDVSDAMTQLVMKLTDFIYLWVFIPMFVVIKKNKKESIDKKKNFACMLKISLISILIGSAMPPYSSWGSLFKLWNRVHTLDGWGPYVYQLNDIIQSLKPTFNNLFGYDNALKRTRDYFNERKYNISNNEYTNIFEGKNVLAIHAESLQSFALDLKFNGKEVTPNINKLAKEGIYFSNFYAQVGVGTSSDTEFTYATSLLPSNNGTVFVNYANNKYITIQSLLKDKGYYTFSMHANVGDFWNRNAMYDSMGYDKFYDKDSFIVDEEYGLGLSDASFFRQVVRMIEEIDNEVGKPYYGTLITLTNHTPWKDANLYGDNNLIADYLKNSTIGKYIMTVNYMDKTIGNFISEMDKKGLLDNTVIIIYGDHDSRIDKKQFDYLYNYDPVSRKIRNEDDSGYNPFNDYDYELNRKVPFIIWTKETAFKLEKNTPMGMIDVLPTLGNMLGINNKYALGKDIMEIKNDEAIIVFKDGSYITNKIYYNAKNGEVYMLTNGILENDYLNVRNKITNDMIEISNNIITYDLLDELVKNTNN